MRVSTNRLNEKHYLQAKPNSPYFRLAHLLPTTMALDIYIDSHLIHSHLMATQRTSYYGFLTGEHTLTLYPSGTKAIPYYQETFYLPTCGIFTCALLLIHNNLYLELINDTIDIPPSLTMVKLNHFASSCHSIDLLLNDHLLFKAIDFHQTTYYATVMPRLCNELIISTTDHHLPLLYSPVSLLPNRAYTFYIIDAKTSSTIDLVTSLDGSPFLC